MAIKENKGTYVCADIEIFLRCINKPQNCMYSKVHFRKGKKLSSVYFSMNIAGKEEIPSTPLGFIVRPQN